MRQLKLQLESAGLSRYSPLQFLAASVAAALIVSAWLELSFEVLGLSVFGFLATMGIAFEALSLRAKARSDSLTKLWPEILDLLHSSLASGSGLIDALSDVSIHGPLQVRAIFKELVEQVDRGISLEEGLDGFKSQFGQIQADRLAELIRLVHEAGGGGMLDALRTQSSTTRNEIALFGELESKQGWVTGTAKLAIVAPWIIIATLASRPENVAIYNTATGISILGFGLALSILAYRLVVVLGSLPKPSRVFTK